MQEPTELLQASTSGKSGETVGDEASIGRHNTDSDYAGFDDDKHPADSNAFVPSLNNIIMVPV